MTGAVVFDLDGTLVDTPSVIGDLLTQVLAELGHDRPRAEITGTIGQPLEPSLAGLLGAPVLDPLTVTAVARYRELFAGQVFGRGTALLFPEVADGLAALADAAIPCAIATSKDERTAKALLDTAGIAGHFPVVIADDMVAHGKPHPESGERAARELGFTPTECAYVGDAVTDMTMAVAAGMTPVGVGYGVATAAELAAAGAATVHDSFADVTAFLLNREPAREAGA